MSGNGKPRRAPSAGESVPAEDDGAAPARTVVFDCFSGIAGDMALAALVDAGAPLDVIISGLQALGLPPFELSTERVTRGGLGALHLRVQVSREQTYQPGAMRTLLREAKLPPRVAERSLAAIDALAAGEAAAHGTDSPHFHEVGGVDALIDIVGTMLALEALAVEAAACPVVTVGAGTITASGHGHIPAAPGPAAACILREAGFPMRFVEAGHELVTPTGAAILAAVARPGTVTVAVDAIGAGAGTADPPGRPNALRVFIGLAQRAAPAPGGTGRSLVVGLEANIDDMSPALLANARDRLLEEGALDAWLEPIGMKKGRAATKLCALVRAEDEERFAGLVLAETTTLGVRALAYRRYETERRVETVATTLGPVRVKVSGLGTRVRRVPEFEDVKAIAARLGEPALAVQAQIESELHHRSPDSAPD